MLSLIKYPSGGGGGTGTVTSVGLTMPTAFSVANSPVTTAGTLAVTGAGTTAQYIRGDGTLATFPSVIGTANNGLSLSGSNFVLGQDVSQVGAPATLLSNREIPVATFNLRFTDATTNVSILGAGTFNSTRITGDNVVVTNTRTANATGRGLTSTATTTFGGAFTNDTANGQSVFAIRRFNTQAAGSTITTTTSNRQGVYTASLQFENDVAANNNTITVSGANPVSVYQAKVDFWPGASNQVKTINGAIACYSTYFDATQAPNSSITTFIDFEAGLFSGNVSPLTITNRYGFRVLDLNAGSQTTTNRWAFYQEGATDKNYFAGVIGIGQTSPTARLHIAAGTATAGTAPIKLTSGTNLTTAETGAFEYNGVSLFFTPTGTTRLRTVLTDNTIPTNGQIPVGNGTNYTNATLTQGAGITITNGAGTITIATNAVRANATLDFPSTAGGASSDLTIAAPGAADGDPVCLGVPAAAVLANGTYMAWVSSANVVTVRFTNDDVTSQDPPSGTFRIIVFK